MEEELLACPSLTHSIRRQGTTEVSHTFTKFPGIHSIAVIRVLDQRWGTYTKPPCIQQQSASNQKDTVSVEVQPPDLCGRGNRCTNKNKSYIKNKRYK